jgi:predicted esterase
LLEIKTVFPADDNYYTYYTEDPETIKRAVADLSDFVKEEGPYDGLIGFSIGAALAAALIMSDSMLKSSRDLQQPIFKVAIFFSSTAPINSVVYYESGIRRLIREEDGTLIHIPTAHIWGRNDTSWAKESQEVANVCASEMRHIFVHDGGHEIPGGKDRTGVLGSVHAIRRAIDSALIAQQGIKNSS